MHFREPGLTHKGDLYHESRAAVAGGVTSYMEMPNTTPQTTTQQLLEDKYTLASRVSLANYSFYMGATNDNLDELLKTDPAKVCGIKIFMGSSTGNMLVDNPDTLKSIFSRSPMLIAVHCEDETIILNNIRQAQGTILLKMYPFTFTPLSVMRKRVSGPPNWPFRLQKSIIPGCISCICPRPLKCRC